MATRFSLSLLLLLLSPLALAQSPSQETGTLTGSVVDGGSDIPLASTTVALYADADSSFVTGTVTGSDGLFRIEGLQPMAYVVRLSFIGFQSQRREAVVSSGGELDLGRIVLDPDVTVLEGAQVVAERAAIEQRADRTVYNVKDQAVTVGGSALNTLETLPSVEVDQDGTVSLRGGQNVAIQIDGRPTPVSGAFLASFLRQIPAETIDRIEVLPTPGASEEASGMSGIINIVLKERAPDRGLAGGVSLTGGTQEAGVSVNLNYNRGRFDLSGAYGYGGNRADGLATADRVYADGVGPFASFDRDEPNERSRGGHFGNVTLDYTLRPGSVLSANVNGYTGADDRDEIATTVFVLRSGNDSTTVRDVSLDGRGSNAQASLRFGQTFDEEGRHTFTAELRGSRSEDGGDEATTLNLAGAPADATTYAEDRTIDELTFETDYGRSLGEGRLALGTRVERESIRNTADLDVPSGVSADGAFDYDRTIWAAYGEASVPLGERLEVQAGLRVEGTDREFTLASGGFGGEDGTFSRSYTNVFPSAFAVYTLSPGTLLKGAYSRRINRPSTRFLSPFNSQADPFTQRRGNTALEPEFTDAYEVTAQYKYFLSVTPFYRRTTDVIQRTFSQEGETTFFTPVNAGTQDSYGADLTLSASIPGLPVRGFVSGSVFRDSFTGVRNAFENTSYSLRTSVRATLTETTSLSFFGFFRGPRAIEDGSSSGFGFSSFALSQKLRGDALVLNLRLSDPFATTRFEFDTANDQYAQIGASDPDRRSVAATLTWTFGPEQRRRRQSGGGGGGGSDDEFGI